MISPLTNVSKVPAATGGGGGVSQSDFDALEITVQTKQDQAQVNTLVTSANIAQDIVNMSVFASQSSVTGAVNSLQAGINGLQDGSQTHDEVTVKNQTVANAADQHSDCFLEGRPDATNTAGVRVRHSVLAAGGQTTAFSHYDTSLSVQKSAPADTLTLTYSADTGDHSVVSTGPVYAPHVSLQHLPLGGAVGGTCYCKYVDATLGISCTSGAVNASVSYTHLTLPTICSV